MVVVLLEEALKAGAIGLGHLQQGVVRRPGEDDRTQIGQFLPTLHRVEGHEVMLPGKQEHRQLEGGQALLLCPPVSDDLHAPPMGAWVAWA